MHVTTKLVYEHERVLFEVSLHPKSEEDGHVFEKRDNIVEIMSINVGQQKLPLMP